jgi:hypothetical protein
MGHTGSPGETRGFPFFPSPLPAFFAPPMGGGWAEPSPAWREATMGVCRARRGREPSPWRREDGRRGWGDGVRREKSKPGTERLGSPGTFLLFSLFLLFTPFLPTYPRPLFTSFQSYSPPQVAQPLLPAPSRPSAEVPPIPWRGMGWRTGSHSSSRSCILLSGFRHGTGPPPIPRWEANRWRKPVEIFQIPKIAPSPAEGLGAFEPKAKNA